MDARKLRLHGLLKPKLGEEAAQELVLALPSSANQLLTKDYLDQALGKQAAELSDKLTWRMITVMGGWTAVGVSLFALMSRLFN